ncbi:glycosyltransferase, partial [Patescibacteria group bacterium]|nr:glycosyltransferase [Patescibacteria group bacterium]
MPQSPESILVGSIADRIRNIGKPPKGKDNFIRKPEKPTGKISIIIVSHNRKGELRKCLRSVMSQKAEPDEVIVVDNGSTDGTMDMVLKDFPSVRLFGLMDNMGLCYAANVGSKNAKGDYIGMVEPNMVLSSNWTQEVVNAFESDSDVGIVCPTFLHHSKYGYINFEFEQPNNELQITNVCFGIRGSIVEENEGNIYDPK